MYIYIYTIYIGRYPDMYYTSSRISSYIARYDTSREELPHEGRSLY